MPVDERRARGDATKERILIATLDLIALGGPGAVTYRAVAARAEVALGQMTYHYPNRGELLAAAFEHHQSRLRASARSLPVREAAALGAVEQAELITGFLREMATTDRLRYLAEFELALEMARDSDLRNRLAPATGTTRAMAVELLSAAGSGSPEADATILSATMEGLLLTWLARPDDPTTEARIDEAVARLVALFFG